MQALVINVASASPLSILLAGDNMQRLLGGLGVIIKISLIAVVLSILLGIPFGLFMTRKNPTMKPLSRAYLDSIRTIPQFVLLLFVFFGSARVLGLSLSGEFSSTLVFAFWDTAKMGDLVRGVLESIPRHQYKNAAMLGLTPGQCNRYVIILQTLRRLLPPAVDLMTRMIRATSLAVLIDVVEVLKTGQQIIDASRFQYPTAVLPIHGIIFLLYFLMCWSASMLARCLEKHWIVQVFRVRRESRQMKEFKQEVQLSIRGSRKSYSDVEILKGVNLDARQGEVAVTLGPSGSGRSIFLHCINGLEKIQDGKVKLDGVAINGFKNSVLSVVRQKFGMVFQSYDLFPHMNTLDNIMLAPTKVQEKSRKEAEAEVRELFSCVNPADKERAYPHMLSGGQRQRVAVTYALAMHPELMLFDGVTTALDPKMVREVLDVIMELSEQGLTVLIVTHEMSSARAVIDRIVFMDGGYIVETGTPEELFTAPKTERACTFLDNFQFIVEGRKEEKSA